MMVNQGASLISRRLLILGGTTEATALAKRLASLGEDAVFSYAGRVARPKRQPLSTRVGGFGGVNGLTRYLRAEGITHVIDATHPFAAQMSRNAVSACEATSVELLALVRAPWTEQPGDRWTLVPDIPAAVTALQGYSRRVMLALGRLNLPAFEAAPQHFYLLRLVDPPEGALSFPNSEIIVDRGPFTFEGDFRLLARQRIDLVVSKNSGGEPARAKIDAARELGIEVIMINRPTHPAPHRVETVEEVLEWLGHTGTDLGV